MAEYKLEFDIPLEEVDEPGWSQEVLFSGLDRNRDLKVGDNLWYEAKTGTLCLQPVHEDIDAWYSPDTDTLRLDAADLDYVIDKWDGQASILMAPPGSTRGQHHIMRSKATLIETMVDLAISGAIFGITFGLRLLRPILATKEEWPINSAVGIILETTGNAPLSHKEWLAIQFGDFCLVLGTNCAELWWSVTGTCQPDSWRFMKHFSRFPDLRTGSTVMGPSLHGGYFHHITIIPFGRGNIWFVVRGSNGVLFSDIYHHEDAAWNEVDQRYEITDAGKVVICADENYAGNVGIGIHRVGYKTSGSYTNMRYRGVPYAPTSTPQVTPRWVRTLGTPSVSASLLDENEAPWVSTGGHTMWKAQVDMLGDGTCTPWVDAVSVEFPEMYRTVTPGTPFSVGQEYFEKLSPGRGEEWDDEKVSVSIRDDGSNADVSALSLRAEIGARLLIDDVPYGYYWFKRPKTIANACPTTRAEYGGEAGTAVERRRNVIHLTGANFGVARIRDGRFWFPPSYGNLSHPAAVRRVLNHRGFADAYVITDDDDDVKLPTTTRHGEGTDKGETDLKSQPQMNASVEEFLLWIRETFSGNPRWALRYRSDGKWHYARNPEPTTPTVTFYKDGTTDEIAAGRLWYERDLEFELEPPEANVLVAYGETDTGDIIAQPGIVPDSISYSGSPKPANYLGFERRVVVIDKAMNTPDMLASFVTAGLPILSEAILYVTWRGPFTPDLDIGDGARLEGVGLVQVLSIQPEGTSPRQLELTASTTYSGKVVEAES